MTDRIINFDTEDITRREEFYHETQLKKELKKHGIEFEVSSIAPHGMRLHTKKQKNIFKIK